MPSSTPTVVVDIICRRRRRRRPPTLFSSSSSSSRLDVFSSRRLSFCFRLDVSSSSSSSCRVWLRVPPWRTLRLVVVVVVVVVRYLRCYESVYLRTNRESASRAFCEEEGGSDLSSTLSTTGPSGLDSRRPHRCHRSAPLPRPSAA